jgi:hypothetical protein
LDSYGFLLSICRGARNELNHYAEILDEIAGDYVQSPRRTARRESGANQTWIGFCPHPSDNSYRYEVSITIRVELNPVMESQLAAEGLASGIALELYAQRLLQESMASRSKAPSRASQEEFRAFLDALARKAPNVPQLRSETFSREMIYGEHA